MQEDKASLAFLIAKKVKFSFPNYAKDTTNACAVGTCPICGMCLFELPTLFHSLYSSLRTRKCLRAVCGA